MLGRFAYAAWFWAVLAILAIIGWPLVVALPGRSAPHRAVSAISRLFFRLVAIPVEFRQEGEVPPRNVILVSNHASYLDSLAILSGLRGPTSFVAKEEPVFEGD